MDSEIHPPNLDEVPTRNEPRSRPTSRLPSTLTLGFRVAQYVSRALECQVRVSVSVSMFTLLHCQCQTQFLRRSAGRFT